MTEQYRRSQAFGTVTAQSAREPGHFVHGRATAQRVDLGSRPKQGSFDSRSWSTVLGAKVHGCEFILVQP
jgi:hypothetical protein